MVGESGLNEHQNVHLIWPTLVVAPLEDRTWPKRRPGPRDFLFAISVAAQGPTLPDSTLG